MCAGRRNGLRRLNMHIDFRTCVKLGFRFRRIFFVGTTPWHGFSFWCSASTVYDIGWLNAIWYVATACKSVKIFLDVIGATNIVQRFIWVLHDQTTFRDDTHITLYDDKNRGRLKREEKATLESRNENYNTTSCQLLLLLELVQKLSRKNGPELVGLAHPKIKILQLNTTTNVFINKRQLTLSKNSKDKHWQPS